MAGDEYGYKARFRARLDSTRDLWRSPEDESLPALLALVARSAWWTSTPYAARPDALEEAFHACCDRMRLSDGAPFAAESLASSLAQYVHGAARRPGPPDSVITEVQAWWRGVQHLFPLPE